MHFERGGNFRCYYSDAQMNEFNKANYKQAYKIIMKKNGIVLITIFLFIVVSLKRSFAQSRLEVIADAFEITEAAVVDSTIIKVLDSSFTFLRTPSLEYGTYYYGLNISKIGNNLNDVKQYKKITFYAIDQLIINNKGLEDFKKDKMMLFKYKDVPIIVFDFDNLATQFFKPLNKKANYFYYYKVDEKVPDSIIVPKKTYTQQVEFILRKNYLNFLEYKILYAFWDETGSMILDFPDE